MLEFSYRLVADALRATATAELSYSFINRLRIM
jgi:hypothetical protein